MVAVAAVVVAGVAGVVGVAGVAGTAGRCGGCGVVRWSMVTPAFGYLVLLQEEEPASVTFWWASMTWLADLGKVMLGCGGGVCLCMCECVCVFFYVRAYVCTSYVCIHARTYVCMYVCMDVFIYVCIMSAYKCT